MGSNSYELKYPLTSKQYEASQAVLSCYLENENVLIYAVCGAGKTEMIVESIDVALRTGKQVGICIPRKDLVVEIGERLIEIFPTRKVVMVYGGHSEELYGDIVLCTAHQIHRYPNYFDLLIIDEVDAFPYFGNDNLHKLVDKSIKGSFILMSATPPAEIMKQVDSGELRMVCLHQRYHKYPLPVPKLSLQFPFSIKYSLKKYLRKTDKQYLIYVHSKSVLYELKKYLEKDLEDIGYVYAGKENNPEVIQNFRDGKFRFLLTTTLLERGITIKDVQVIVYEAHQPLFDLQTLLQICGRVGRHFDCPTGNIILMSFYKTNVIKKAIATIIELNKDLAEVT